MDAHQGNKRQDLILSAAVATDNVAVSLAVSPHCFVASQPVHSTDFLTRSEAPAP
jgi:hypothetical protein